MDTEKYGRSISLNCPTCGNTQFVGSGDNSAEPIACSSCGRTLTTDELIHENSENIAEHIDEMKEQVIKDISKHFKETLKNAFKGSKNIRIK